MERDPRDDRNDERSALGFATTAPTAPVEAARAMPSTAAAREDERHRRVMASAERVMRKHRNVFAALAK